MLLPLLALGSFALHAQNCAAPNQAAVETQVRALIARMTLAEKVAQLGDQAPAIPRLGLRGYNWWNEGLHGLARNGYATVFPQAIGLAATFDPALLQQVGDTVSTEARAKFNQHGGITHDSPRYGGLTVWSPNINIFRDPRWGRGQETYGEDPFLTGTLASAFVRGVQGTDSDYLKADATPKHFAAHSGPERGRDSFNAIVSQHDLADTYFVAFHTLATQAQASALMCSYNEINGTPSCASQANLDGMVRGRWGFRGYLVSDCDAVGDIAEYHHWAPDAAHGAAAALNAGVDLDCGSTYNHLAEAVSKGLTTEKRVDESLERLLMARARLGLLADRDCTPWAGLGAADVTSPAHHALAMRAAEESIVLLKNSPAGGSGQPVLPLSGSTRVAVIGPAADSVAMLEANYHGTARQPVTLLQGISQRFPHTAYAQGSLLAQGLAAPVPRTALRTPDGKPGLRAEYFAQPVLSGAPLVTTVVPTLELDLDRVGPTPAITTAQYAARWTGSFVPPAPGTYTLSVRMERCWDCTAHDQFQVWLDGKLAVDNHGAKADADHVTVTVTDTQPHALGVELLHTGADEGITLSWQPPAAALLEEAVRAARQADVIVAAVGLGPDLEGEALQVSLPGFDGGDRTLLELPEAQRRLLEQLEATGKPVVVVLSSGSAVALAEHGRRAAAVLEAWYGGEAAGEALARVLDGSVNPSGRLPVTFYTSVASLPAFTDYSMAHRTYRYFNGEVEYPFGFGLSYTHFRYGPVGVVQAGASVHLSTTVGNTGSRAGAEVSELYLKPPRGLGGAPRLMLRGVERTTLAPGESQTVHFDVPLSSFATVDEAGVRAPRAGVWHVFVGGSQPAAGDPRWVAVTVPAGPAAPAVAAQH